MSEFIQSLNQAIELHKAGNLKRAKAMYMKILSDHPNQPEANHMLGVIAYQEKEYELSIKLISKAIEIESDNPSYYLSLGMAYQEKGDLNEAEVSYLKALNKGEEKYGLDFVPSKFYLANRFESALNKIKQKGSSHELNKIYLGLAEIFFSKAQFGKSLDELLKANEGILQGVELKRFNLQIAKCYFALSQAQDGVIAFKKALLWQPSLDDCFEMENFLTDNNLDEFLPRIAQIKNTIEEK
ncbi:MAG: tetratricopeptide repeat protein [Candidatus Caenarcaniphilales bacterium]|nr:tetratricopeptide repeat protein [Candidatus Caenarcaniphilales bacterium]